MVHFNNQTPWWILFTYHDLCCWWKPVIVVVMILLKVGKQWTLPDSASIVFLLLKIDFTKVFLLEMVCVCVRIWGGKRHSVVSFFFFVLPLLFMVYFSLYRLIIKGVRSLIEHVMLWISFSLPEDTWNTHTKEWFLEDLS